MARGWVWLQLSIAWLPMWALFAAIIVIVHGATVGSAAIGSLRMIAPAAVLAFLVYKFASRMPWPHPFRLGFIGVHVLAAILYAITWYVLICAIDSLVLGYLVTEAGAGRGIFILTGIWLYIVVVGVAYANLAAQRTAKIEAQAARMQLDALRSQLHPHFLFNALHAIVQLIPMNPRAATHAAEQLAGALRTTITEQRDMISLAEEWAFVERYLAIERIRFGDRLGVVTEISEIARSALLPSFALQTLVENSVRHAATPRIEATQVTILASVTNGMLTLRVTDDGAGTDPVEIERSAGTGIRRLRERMRWLYGDRAQLNLASSVGRGFTATLIVPQLDYADD
jgi:two-component system, LytTR family, sensor kinase